jgi:ABC-2 type transport system ATP-binding protein
LPDVPEFYSFMTAEEYLSLCGELAGMSATERRRRGGELLSLVGLSGEKHRIRGYSRGMKQRLGIAQALLGKPCLLLCDEPTSALDPIGRKEILDILSAIKEETTVLFSTHVLSDVEKICTDVAFLQDGRVAVEGRLEDIRRRYRKDEYRIEMERPEDAARLLAVFSCLQREDDGCLRLCQTGEDLFSVLSFISENRLSLVRTERCEPTLEALFEEVVQR